ncbi:MAG: hypothetical protein PWP24_1698, partial [Clostridiales bacterium]|nr:hypothetical protein [Clostridiales bacterium]
MNNHYFEGIYLKQQNKKDTLSLIPAYHVDKRGRSSASLQVITNQQTCYVPFEAKDYRRDKKRELIYLGKNIFGRSGCQFDIKRKGISLKGYLHYDRLVAPSYDIMGPFRYVPFMECRHQVISLSHQVEGKVCWNQKEYVFSGSRGYIEGDRGSSFPSQYLWTQASV